MSEEQPVGKSRRTMGQNQNDNIHTQGQGQSVITAKQGQDQSDTIKQLGQSQSEKVEKLAQDEETFAVFEEQEERLLRMEINCENLLQKQVHSQPHRLKAHSHQARVKVKAKNFFDI